MLTRGDRSAEPGSGLEALIVAEEQLCKILVNDYYNTSEVKDFGAIGYKGWSYGPRSDSGLQDSEADLLSTILKSELQHNDGNGLLDRETYVLAYDAANVQSGPRNFRPSIELSE
jgi:hypothetical protein